MTLLNDFWSATMGRSPVVVCCTLDRLFRSAVFKIYVCVGPLARELNVVRDRSVDHLYGCILQAERDACAIAYIVVFEGVSGAVQS